MSTADSRQQAQQALTALLDAYRFMEIPIRRYVLLYLVPAMAIGVGSLGAVLFLPLPAIVAGPLAILGLLLPAAALGYPKLVRDRQEKEIRERFFLFLTHVTVLSMTNVDRIEVFRTLANEEEYGALATEMRRLVALVDAWNQSLDDACRLRAQRVPSDLLSDFLDRLAYTVGAGQSLGQFLRTEQDAILQQFVTRYENDLKKLNVLKELYLSMMLSTSFLLVFATVLPIIVGINPTFVVSGVVALFAVIQTSFVLFVHMVSPYDLVWYVHESYRTEPLRRIRRATIVGVAGFLVTTGISAGSFLGYLPSPGSDLPLLVYLAFAITPLLYPGLVTWREEGKIKYRDQQFESFIRALGSVESVKQTSTSNVLRSLKNKNFGPLTGPIEGLYRRLAVRIDTVRAWDLFAAESSSYLIEKFGDMYVNGRQLGGDPGELGDVISKDLGEILKLREQRGQEVVTMVGVVYGLTAATVFAFFTGLEIVAVLVQIFEELSIPPQFSGQLLYTDLYDLQVIEFLLLVAVLVNDLLASVMIRVIDRGHFLSSLIHFVLLTWLSAIAAFVTQQAIGALISF